ncbi:MAG: MASE1 domain-containing protein [Bdellovibrionota bacterium]
MSKVEAKIRLRKWGSLFLVGGCYYVAGQIGLLFAIVHTSITALWPPSGIAVAALFLLGRGMWPGIFLGAFTVNYFRGTPFWVSMGIGVGNTLAGVVGAGLLRRLTDFRPDFSRIKDVLTFGVIAGAIDPVFSASIGILSLRLGGLLARGQAGDAWFAWWSGDAMGVLIFAPLIFVSQSVPWRLPPLSRILEALLMVGGFTWLAVMFFQANEMLVFLVYPFSVWAALRFRHLGVNTLALILTGVSIPILILRLAPQSHLQQHDVLFLVYRLQVILSTASLTGMLLAADITSRRRTEDDLATKEEQLQAIVKHTPDHILIQDRELRYTYLVNPELGFSEGEMLGKTDYEILAPEDAENLTKIKRKVMDSGTTMHVEIPLKTKSGKREFFEGSYVPRRNERGEVNGLIGYFRNVTERKQAEKVRAAWQESENANRAKDQFIATLSHELRTPLTAILAWIQLIKAGMLDEETRQVGISAIEDCALTQNQLINDLLDVSRIVTGKMVLKPQRVSVHAVLLSALDAIRPSAEKKSLKIVDSYGKANLETIADPTRLKQVFWNLLSNSVKFTPAGGTITVITDTVGASWRVRVVDTGQGIAKEVLPLLFRRFSQGDASSTRVHGGMGLGLSLSHSLLELQGGTVEAASAGAGLGATFTVCMPLLDRASGGVSMPVFSSAPLEPAELRTQQAALAKIKILFFDDEPRTCDAFRTALSSFGANVKVAASAKEALDSLADFDADILVSDLAMPKEDGLSLLRKIRASGDLKNRDLPAIAFSAFGGQEVGTAALDAGFQAHLSKPVNLPNLVRKIQEIAGEPAGSPQPF